MKKITFKGGLEKNTLGGPYRPPPNTPGLKKRPDRNRVNLELFTTHTEGDLGHKSTNKI